VLAILYELIYERVFEVDQPVRLALEMIHSKPFLTHGPGISTNGNTDRSRWIAALYHLHCT